MSSPTGGATSVHTGIGAWRWQGAGPWLILAVQSAGLRRGFTSPHSPAQLEAGSLSETLHVLRVLKGPPGWPPAVRSLLSSPISAEFAFCQVDASIALTLALAVLCDLLQQWDQLAPGLPILLGWLLGEGDDLTGYEESTHQVILGTEGTRRWA